MDDGVPSPATMLGTLPDSATDLDFMDELFLEGCWLETTDGPVFPNQSPANSGAFFNPSLFLQTWETNGNSSMNPSENSNQELMQRPFFEQMQEGPVNPQSSSQNMVDVEGFSGQSEDPTIESHLLSRRWWIGPTDNQGPASLVMERLMKALVYIKNLMRDKDVLVQVWLPVTRDGRNVLTTIDRLFLLDSSCFNLTKYRNISVNYQFSTGEDSREMVKGLPGRVFSGKVPEWTPDVRFFRSDEYPRVDHAQRYDVRGTLALPIFEQGSKTCLGVIEVVTTTQKIKYQHELESVCKALEAVNLRSSRNLNTQNVKACDKPYQAALPEIQEVLRSACETHKLPLAQTWVSCIQQGKYGCRHSDENYIHCVSTVDHACHVTDPYIQGFHETCSEHHLLKGQGIVGSAFMTNQPCFSNDITSFLKTEYPLSHHARMFGLHAAVAIRLRSVDTGLTDFVLEFFLPVDCRDPEEQKQMLKSLSLIIKQICRSLRVVTDKELEEGTDCPDSDVVIPSDPRPSGSAYFAELQHSGNDVSAQQKPREVLGVKSSKLNQHKKDLNLQGGVGVEGGVDCSTLVEGSFSSVGVSEKRDKRRTKAEKAITLEVLRKYFSGSLKDAAKNIGVCSTTLKRICRQHGIKRWPSRKIKKVGHSLQKLQLVIDSVEGASGAFPINSFYTNFPELTSPNLSGTSPFSSSKPSDFQPIPKATNLSPEGGVFSPSKALSSSCSQSSSSSQCCSSRTQQHPPTCNLAGNDDRIAADNSCDSVLKRGRSEAMLQAVGEDRTELLPRSQSHKILREQQKVQSVPSSLKTSGGVAQGESQRVKVTYGDEKTRFRMQSDWRYEDLVQEISKRFSIEDMSKFDIKYLDDDSEWVLLTCDADLEECLDVCQSSQSHTIKLSLQLSRHHLQRLIGSFGPS